MTQESKIIIGALVAVLAWSIYSHNELSEKITWTQQLAQTCSCPQNNYDQVNNIQIRQLMRNSAASHSYFEHLLEGLVRHNGLPLDAARKAFSEGMKPYGGVPEGWRFLSAWEGTNNKPEQAPKTVQ